LQLLAVLLITGHQRKSAVKGVAFRSVASVEISGKGVDFFFGSRFLCALSDLCGELLLIFSQH
jgi:hypothetical protein